MKEFLHSKIGRYIFYFGLFMFMRYGIGFELTVLFIGSVIAGDIDFNNDNK